VIAPSFKRIIESMLATIPDVEYLDITLAHIREGQRADYCLREMAVIIEQKECRSDRHEQIAAAEKRTAELAAKYGFDEQAAREVATHLGSAGKPCVTIPNPTKDWTEDDQKEAMNRLYTATRFIEADLSKANKQIGNSKGMLDCKHAGGLVIFINEAGGNIFIYYLQASISRLLGTPRFPNIDGVVLFQKHKGYTIAGRTAATLYMSAQRRNKSVDDIGRKLIEISSGQEATRMPLVPDHIFRQ
jgi:hypothetical protein